MAGSLGVTETSLTFTDLVAGPGMPFTKMCTVQIPDVALARGTVMARVTSTGELDPYVAGGGDGIGTPVGILMEDIAIGAAAVEALVGFGGGSYIRSALTGIDDAGVLALEARGIYIAE